MKGAEPFFYKKGKIGCILSHGYTGTPKEVRELGKYLADKNITTIGPLLPGHGTTIEDLKLTTANDWYNEYVNAVEKLKEHCTKIFVCGLSLGGLLTLKYASENSVDGVITLAAPARFSCKFHEENDFSGKTKAGKYNCPHFDCSRIR
ncbi:MAG: alpha/beta hydrolase [Candidatus Heimdallarchaeota archaeon]